MTLRERLIARGLLTDDGKLTDAGNAYVAAIKAELRRSGGKARERVGE